MLSFCKFWTARHNVVYHFLVSVAHPAHWISAIFYHLILAWYDPVAKLWSFAAFIWPSVSVLSPVLLSHWLVLFWSTSASLVHFGYLPCNAFFFNHHHHHHYYYFNVMMYLCLECGIAVTFSICPNFTFFFVFFIDPSK